MHQGDSAFAHPDSPTCQESGTSSPSVWGGEGFLLGDTIDLGLNRFSPPQSQPAMSIHSNTSMTTAFSSSCASDCQPSGSERQSPAAAGLDSGSIRGIVSELQSRRALFRSDPALGGDSNGAETRERVSALCAPCKRSHVLCVAVTTRC